MATSSKGVREKNDRRVFAKNRKRTNNIEVCRSKQGRQREHPNYRSRIVVREVKKQHGALPGHMLFSNMPPLEAVKILCSELATEKRSKKGKDVRLVLYDISREHFYGEAQREIYVTLPPGDEQEGYCAILKMRATCGRKTTQTI